MEFCMWLLGKVLSQFQLLYPRSYGSPRRAGAKERARAGVSAWGCKVFFVGPQAAWKPPAELRRPGCGLTFRMAETDADDIHQFVIVRRLLKERCRASFQRPLLVGLRVTGTENDDRNA